MGKVIIKPIIHISDKGLNDLYKLISDQYKENDIIVVPYYCDVYVVDGNPELKIEKSSADCMYCKYSDGDGNCCKPTDCDKQEGKRK